MAQNDMIRADDHQATFKILANALFNHVVQLFTFLLLVNHEFLLQLDLKKANKFL